MGFPNEWGHGDEDVLLSGAPSARVARLAAQTNCWQCCVGLAGKSQPVSSTINFFCLRSHTAGLKTERQRLGY